MHVGMPDDIALLDNDPRLSERPLVELRIDIAEAMTIETPIVFAGLPAYSTKARKSERPCNRGGASWTHRGRGACEPCALQEQSLRQYG